MNHLKIITLILLVSFSALQVACYNAQEEKKPAQLKPEVKVTDAENKWGIRVIGIRPSAADYMLDFRFRVLDKEKVSMIMDRKVKPQVIVEKNGSRLFVPVTSKLGPLRQSAKFAKENKNYFMFFANPAKQVKSGDLVTVMIGDFKQEHIVVQ